jgi:hypothetical protein
MEEQSSPRIVQRTVFTTEQISELFTKQSSSHSSITEQSLLQNGA